MFIPDPDADFLQSRIPGAENIPPDDDDTSQTASWVTGQLGNNILQDEDNYTYHQRKDMQALCMDWGKMRTSDYLQYMVNNFSTS